MIPNKNIKIDELIYPNSWQEVLKEELSCDYMLKLFRFLEQERQIFNVFPAIPDVFNAFNKTAFKDIKVVILGQDPYHGLNQAHGLSFSVPTSIKTPPSLVNIYKELQSDIEGFKAPIHGNLIKWAEQGVFLLNTVLTVRAHQAFSHRNKGWELFTDSVIQKISQYRENIVFVLWGTPAKSKAKLIDSNKHLILTSTHPSPLSAYRGFLGCKHFSQINTYLANKGCKIIDWHL
tara:strand:+ start:3050 stop:3748 length:699 start_codon:yes stop_codon:yes gene_type:complete